eukprot:5837295-Prymnesium_polylepis.1
MEPIMTELLRRVIAPLAAALYPREPFVSSLDHHHSFVVAYKYDGGDKGLDMHHDASEVTLNAALGGTFSGAGLRFCGQFGSASHRRTTTVASHERGRAILHLGRQRHGADDLSSGERCAASYAPRAPHPLAHAPNSHGTLPTLPSHSHPNPARHHAGNFTPLNLIVWARSSAFRGAAAFGHIEPDGYPKEAESSEPELVCLSKANDDDYNAQLQRLDPAALAVSRTAGCEQCEASRKKPRIVF